MIRSLRLILGTILLILLGAGEVAAQGKRDPKCSFLRAEYVRLQRIEVSDAEAALTKVSGPAALAELGRSAEEFAAAVAASETRQGRLAVIWSAVSSCERGEVLSSLDRLPKIEQLRAAALKKAIRRLENVVTASDQALTQRITAAVNSSFDQEIKSFYNKDVVREELESDVIKDYPTLTNDIARSAMPAELKEFFRTNLRHLKYEEAGRLTNIITGVDPDASIGQAYLIRKAVTDRVVSQTAREEADAAAEAAARPSLASELTPLVLAGVGSTVVMLIPIGYFVSRARAKYRAFKHGKLRVPFFFGAAELVLWEPGETVVILRHKRPTPMADRDGGYTVISALRGEEYKGRISYKTQLMAYESGAILTSDGLSVRFDVGIWWRISVPSTYLSRIASDYKGPDGAEDLGLTGAAREWIKDLAGGTMREQINKLPAEKLISPYVQQYIQVAEGKTDALVPQFSDLLREIRIDLNAKTDAYGIEVERLEVKGLSLPDRYQSKLEAVRVAFLEPYESKATSDARRIALQSLADVIGTDRVGLIEVLKHVDLSRVAVMPGAPGFNVSIVQPIAEALKQQAQQALPAGDKPALPAAS